MKAALRAFRPFLAGTIALSLCLAAAGALVAIGKRTVASDLRALNAARNERRNVEERLARAVQEARELEGHAAIWQRLNEAGIVGEERRLEWLDALARIRAARGLRDLRYQIEPQTSWKSDRTDAKVEIRSSRMKVELALLHEGELLRFLEDLRASGSAYYAVRKCSMQRAAVLAGKCEIDAITLVERKGSP